MVNTVKFDKEYFKNWFKNLPEEKKQERNLYRSYKRRLKKAAWVIRLGGCCFDCKQVYPDCVYEFHHIDHTTKEVTPAKLFMLSDLKIEKELSKCVLLCANCHRLRHHKDDYEAHGKRKL